MADELKVTEDQNVESGMDKIGAKAAIDLYSRALNSRRSGGFDIDLTWKKLVDAYNVSMNGTNSDVFQVKSKLLFYSLNSLVKNMKRPVRRFKTSGEETEKTEAIFDAVDMVQVDGGLYDCITEDFNLFSRFMSIGDSFIMMGYGDEKTPVKFTIPNITSVFIDPTANCMRNKTGIGTVGEVLVIQEMSYDKAKLMYPDVEFSSGRLPMTSQWDNNFNKTQYQKYQQENMIVEIGHYFNIDAEEPYYSIIAGLSATQLKESKGEEYPFIDQEDKPFIPLVHFKGIATPTGFYNFGIWHLLFDYKELIEKVRNLAYKHIQTNVNPVGIVNIEGEAAVFNEQWELAREAQELGERGFIINQVRNGSNTSSGNITELIQNPLTQEYERLLNDAYTEIKRCGIPIDEYDIPSSQAVTNTLTIEASKNKFIQDAVERNVESFRDLDILTMAMIAKSVSADNEKPVVTSAGRFTLGAIADALNNPEVNIDVDVESRSGAYKTEAYELMASNEILQLSVGTSFESKAKGKALRLRGVEVTDEELTPQQPEGQPGMDGQIPEVNQAVGQGAQIKELIAKNAPVM